MDGEFPRLMYRGDGDALCPYTEAKRIADEDAQADALAAGFRLTPAADASDEPPVADGKKARAKK